jgi:hypothetical protein
MKRLAVLLLCLTIQPLCVAGVVTQDAVKGKTGSEIDAFLTKSQIIKSEISNPLSVISYHCAPSQRTLCLRW